MTDKPMCLVLLLTACLWSPSGMASEPQSAGSFHDYSTVEKTVVMKSLREVHDTSLFRRQTDQYYCDNHLLEMDLTLRQEMSSDEWFFTIDIDMTLDGKKLDLSRYLAELNTSRYQRDVAVQYFCVNSQITIFFYLDQGTGTVFGKEIGRLYVDLDTGDLMSEPRKSPKR